MSDDVKCGCGCNDHEHDDDIMETMTLTLEDDTELECGVIGVFEVDGLVSNTFNEIWEDDSCDCDE